MPLIDVGEPIPRFQLPDQNGDARASESFLGRPLVLYFYPKDDTTACTEEACTFRDMLPRFGAMSAAVVGVSPDSVRSHARFVQKYKLTFPLLSDEPVDGVPRAITAFGVWGEKSMYGRRYMGVIRTTYLVDSAGRVVRRWDAVKVKGHAEEVAGAVASLTGGVPVVSPKVRVGKSARTSTTQPDAKAAEASARGVTKKAAKKTGTKKGKKTGKKTVKQTGTPGVKKSVTRRR
jgi:peroxiredoxin Q/BCP